MRPDEPAIIRSQELVNNKCIKFRIIILFINVNTCEIAAARFVA